MESVRCDGQSVRCDGWRCCGMVESVGFVIGGDEL